MAAPTSSPLPEASPHNRARPASAAIHRSVAAGGVTTPLRLSRKRIGTMDDATALRHRTAPFAEPRPAPAGAPVDILLLHYTGMQTAKARWPGSPTRRPRCPATISSSRTGGSRSSSTKAGGRGTPARHAGPGDTTSIRARSASSSPSRTRARLSRLRRAADRGADRASAWASLPAIRFRRSGCSPIPTWRRRARRIRASCFPGVSFTRAGIGHWVPPAPIVDGPELGGAIGGGPSADLQQRIQAIRLRRWRGVGVRRRRPRRWSSPSSATSAPSVSTAIADVSTVPTLDSLIAALPGKADAGA